MSTQKNEHNPEIEAKIEHSQELARLAYKGGNPVALRMLHDEALPELVSAIRRITPPTDTTGPVIDTKFVCRCGNRSFGMHEPMCPLGKADTTGSGREGETPETDAVVYKWSIDGDLHSPVENELYKHACQLERQRDAALAQVEEKERVLTSYRGIEKVLRDDLAKSQAQVEALRRDKEELVAAIVQVRRARRDFNHTATRQCICLEEIPLAFSVSLNRAAIDSAQRQEAE